jgi:glycolate oxidase FAD binding subunit
MEQTLEGVEAIAYIAPEQVARRLSEAFGAAHVQHAIGSHFRVGDEEARVVAYPQNIEELSEMLKLAHAEGWCVVPAGAGTWLEMGNRVVRFHLIVSTARMQRVLEYEPADLTCTVEAGAVLREFNARAAEHRQFIPLDPFGDENATLGGAVATGSYGPLRCAYGTPRDWLIGARVVHADGTISKAGGKVVKNVAGYDLCKLYAGSFGTLAVIAEMSFKLRALPAVEKTLVFYADGAEALCNLAARLFDSDMQPAALELLSPQAGLALEAGCYALVLRCWNEEAETVEWQLGEARRLGAELRHAVLGKDEAAEFWRAYHASETAPEWTFSLRATALPSDLVTMLADVQRLLPSAVIRAHAANGVLRIHGGDDLLNELRPRHRHKLLTELREAAQARGGQMLILRAPDGVKHQLDVWGEPGATAKLMRAIKQQYDPQQRLNHGRFVAGI